MEERGQGSARAGRPPDGPGERATRAPLRGRAGAFGAERIGQILGEWQQVELRIARGFAECRGLSTEQLEDIYHETALALYTRPYASEEHLRNALRTGIKQRALRAHRDERRRGEILAHNAPGLHLIAQVREGQRAPEPAVLAREDRLIATEFLTELSEPERRVFAWLVEGLQYRAIATALEIPVNEARKTVRACARKRERFQLLHDTGRLCGYRAQTIQALQEGQRTSEELAQRAFAHLESCAHCRSEHKTNAKRLRRSFRDQAAALLPPIVIGHLGWLTRLTTRARLLLHRVSMHTPPLGQGGVRERAIAAVAGSGVGAKVTAGVLTVGVLAGGALATHVLEDKSRAGHRHHPHGATATQRKAAPTAPAPSVPPSTPRASSGAGTTGTQREPRGFAYLGVPTTRTSTPSKSARAASASHGRSGAGHHGGGDHESGEEFQRGGGPFSP
jgi:RNA polymerase sigma factor (sigma-70 family)